MSRWHFILRCNSVISFWTRDFKTSNPAQSLGECLNQTEDLACVHTTVNQYGVCRRKCGKFVVNKYLKLCICREGRGLTLRPLCGPSLDVGYWD